MRDLKIEKVYDRKYERWWTYSDIGGRIERK
jgi:hypothetical protein